MSTADPRDRALDQWLRRQVVGDAGAAEPCPDPETLAAWIEGALGADEVSSLEAHASECGRCRETMAALVRVVEPDAGASHQTAVPGEANATRVGPTRAVPRARWLLPLTAAAAASLVWMLAPDSATTPGVAQQEAVQARLEPVVPPSLEALPPSPSTGAEAPQEQPPAPARAREAERSAAPLIAAAAPPPLGDSGGAPARDLDALKAAPAAPTVLDAPDRSAREERRTAEADTAAAPPAPAPPPAQPMAELAATARTRAAGNLAATGAIQSGDPAVQWRLAGPGVVERSTDGAAWSRLETGVAVPFTAGSAPSGVVCWVVGPEGVILRTTDARTWVLLMGPTGDDLVAVEAADASTATVRAADGRAFRTSDGGATWAPLP